MNRKKHTDSASCPVDDHREKHSGADGKDDLRSHKTPASVSSAVSEPVFELIIIGGGAAGLYAGAASPAAKKTAWGKASRLIIESKEETGKKLLITGAGQCNLTHSGSIRDFPAHYHEAGKKIRPVLYAHSNEKVRDFFHEIGVPTLEREDGKIFPQSLSARQVRDALVSKCRDNGYRILCDTACTGLYSLALQTSGARFRVISGRRTFLAENVLVTTGGASVPQTGSDGSFFSVLADFNIGQNPLSPALTPVYVQQYPFSELSGISFPDAEAAVCDKSGQRKAHRRGPILLTHDSFSGPCIIDSSRYIRTGDILKINYLPVISPEKLAALLTEEASRSRANLSAVLTKTLKENGLPLPQRFIDLQLQRAGADPSRRAAETGKKVWRTIASLFTEDTYSVSGKGGFSGAMATRGGVLLTDIHMKTMESVRYPGLFFAGEVLDVDADTGGYNLQFAFSSAALAVKSIFSSPK